MAITVHYCMSDMIGWGITSNGIGSFCKNCGMKKQSHQGCCHDEKKIIKVEKDQKNTQSFFYSAKSPIVEIVTNYFSSNSKLLPGTIRELTFTHSPRFKLKVPSYIYNCVFRI